MGANPNLPNVYFSDTPLYIAITNGKLDIAEALLANKANVFDDSYIKQFADVIKTL